ncbi:cupredoxin domain-containing protein [Thalassobacillus devorans]|jgi:cytochrome c oxidase subunit 2|uniref:cupredoxin domain-containing protein n=1 Tax=Thalassobacillus devorans TaxID=279813 RepID=UPI00048C9A79|nr:cupredoxin domain-containing protein [Thalassobacillus devorans]
MKKFLGSIVLVSLLVILAACGGNENGAEDNQQESTEEEASGEKLDIIATNFQFNENEYTVKAGEPVTINLSNEEGQHGVAIEDFDVNIQGDGESTFTPEEPGEYTIYCSVPCGEGHSDMTSTLVVQ